MTDKTEIIDEAGQSAVMFHGASLCPSCDQKGEFDLPYDRGRFEIACYECEHIYTIEADAAISFAAKEMPASLTAQETSEAATTITVQCLSCGNEIITDSQSLLDEDTTPLCAHCHPDGDLADGDLAEDSVSDEVGNLLAPIDADTPTRFTAGDNPRKAAAQQRVGKTSIILVSILSAGLVITAAMVSLGLYFLTLRADSDISRYIETTILKVAPAEFSVNQATYEISDSSVGRSLLVTISVSNIGEVEGAPEEMKVVLTDANNNPLFSWPLDVTGQIIAPGETTQLYTRLFEPPADFTNLQVFVR